MPPSKKTYAFDQEIETILNQTTDKKTNILLYGSSTFTLWGKDAQEALKPFKVINHGFGGSTAEEADHYFNRMVLPFDFETLILYEGDNDLINPQTTVEDVIFHFKRMLSKMQLHKPKANIIIVEVKPSINRKNLLGIQKQLNRKFFELAQIFPNVHVVPMHDVVFLKPKEFRPNIFLDDGLHFSPLGYKFFSSALLEVLEKLYPNYRGFKIPKDSTFLIALVPALLVVAIAIIIWFLSVI
jgi:lysophospholipase L1-like esterase